MGFGTHRTPKTVSSGHPIILRLPSFLTHKAYKLHFWPQHHQESPGRTPALATAPPSLQGISPAPDDGAEMRFETEPNARHPVDHYRERHLTTHLAMLTNRFCTLLVLAAPLVHLSSCTGEVARPNESPTFEPPGRLVSRQPDPDRWDEILLPTVRAAMASSDPNERKIGFEAVAWMKTYPAHIVSVRASDLSDHTISFAIHSMVIRHAPRSDKLLRIYLEWVANEDARQWGRPVEATACLLLRHPNSAKRVIELLASSEQAVVAKACAVLDQLDRQLPGLYTALRSVDPLLRQARELLDRLYLNDLRGEVHRYLLSELEALSDPPDCSFPRSPPPIPPAIRKSTVPAFLAATQFAADNNTGPDYITTDLLKLLPPLMAISTVWNSETIRVAYSELAVAYSNLAVAYSKLAIKALGAIGSDATAAIPQLLTFAITSDELGGTSMHALAAIDQSGDSWVSTIIANWDRLGLSQRQSLLSILSQRGTQYEDFAPRLVELLDDPNLGRWAHMALKGLGPRANHVLPQLIQRIESKGPRRSDTSLFGSIGAGADAAVPLLLQRLAAGDLRVAPDLASILGADKQLFERLEPLLSDLVLHHPYQFGITMRILGPTGAVYTDRLLEIFRASPESRYAIVEALHAIAADPTSVRDTVLEDIESDYRVTEVAIRYLWQFDRTGLALAWASLSQQAKASNALWIAERGTTGMDWLDTILKTESQEVRQAILAVVSGEHPTHPTVLQHAIEQGWIRGLYGRRIKTSHDLDPRCMAQLIDMFFEGESGVSDDAVLSFGPAAIQPIAKRLDAPVSKQRHRARLLLSKFKDQQLVPILVRSLENPEHSFWALLNLSRLGVSLDPYHSDIIALIQSAADGGLPRGLDPLLCDLGASGVFAVPSLIRALPHSTDRVLKVLNAIGPRAIAAEKSILPYTSHVYSSSEAPTALRTLGALGSTSHESLSCYARGLRDGEGSIRAAAIEALGSIGAVARPWLREIENRAKFGSREERRAARKALQHIR